MSDLFREEAVAGKVNRLEGDVILRQPRLIKVMVAALVLVMAGGLLAMFFGTYNRSEQVRGFLVTSQASARVYAPRPGIFREIGVSEGDVVDEGELLAVIDTDIVSEGGSRAAAQSVESIDTQLELMEERAAVLKSRAERERRNYGSQIESLNQRVRLLAEQIRMQEQIVGSDNALLQRAEKIGERGFISDFELEQRRRQVINAQMSLASLVSAREELTGTIARLASERDQTFLSAIEQEQNIEAESSNLSAERTQYAGQRSYEIHSPISGRISAMQAARGRNARVDQPILIVVPDKSELLATVYAPSSAIGFVKTGQDAKIMFDAFPYQRFGSYDSKVVEYSRIVLDPREIDAPFAIDQPVYRITLKLDRQWVDGFNEQIMLQPGMTLTANLVLDRQSFIDWLLSPLRAVWNRS